MEKVESFTLDHTKVKAPFVRLCCVMEGEKGDKVSKFDLRFLQPNEQSMPTASIHALEHLLAHNIREHLSGVIDFSPMGCRTGFYLTVWGTRTTAEIKTVLEKRSHRYSKQKKSRQPMRYNAETTATSRFSGQKNMPAKLSRGAFLLKYTDRRAFFYTLLLRTSIRFIVS